jgi:MFS family permease
MSSPRPSLTFAVLGIAAAAYAISQTMLVPSLPELEESLHTSPSGVSALMTSFWISGAVTAGLFGRLGDMYGKRRVIVATLLSFSLGGILCALASTLGVMIAGRVLMGCGVGMFPLAYSLIRDEFESRKAVRSIAFLGGIAAIGGAVGQSTGGFVAEHFGVSSIFWISVAMGLGAVLGILAAVPESPVRTGGRVDVVGAFLLTLGLATPLTAIAEAPTWGWADARTLLLLATGAFLIAVFVIFELRRAEPLIDMNTLLLPRIRMTNVATWFVGFGFFGFSVILTQFFQEPSSTGYGIGASATEAGLFLVPGLVLLTITSIFAGRLSARVGPTLTLRLGVAVGTVGVAGLTLSHTSPAAVILWTAILYVGVGGAFGAMPTIILQGVPQSQSGQSTAINTIVRMVGSAVGVQLAATVVTASIVAGGAPTDRGYTIAFALSAAAGIAALFLSFAIPRETPAARERRTMEVLQGEG